MKKMLVTGASGFLGSRVVKYFADKYEICAPSHKEMDITIEQDVYRVVQDFQPDVVIHCAAMSNVGQCQKEPEVSWERNVNGSIYLAKASKEVGAKCLLCSSDQVYFAVPTNIYAKEKLEAEKQGLLVNPDSVFLRLSWMYDPALRDISQRNDFFTSLLPKLPTDETVSFAIHDKRGITDVYEVITNMEKAFEIPGGIYNFGSPCDKTVYEMAVELFTRLELNPSRVLENKEAFQDSPRDLTMNQEMLNQYHIYFSDTTDALVRNFSAALNSK